jgi:hypothetical protein
VLEMGADLGWLTFERLTKLVNEKPGSGTNAKFFETAKGESSR